MKTDDEERLPSPSSDTSSIDSILANRLKLEGNRLFQRENYKEAAEKYKDAITADPTCPAYYSNLCNCYSKLKRFKQMEAAAETCISLVGAVESLRTTAGSIADECKEHTSTNSATEKKSKGVKKFVKGHYWLAMSLKHQRKYKKALVIVEEAVHLSPKNTDLKLLHAEIKQKIESYRCENVSCTSNHNNEIDAETSLMLCSRCQNIKYCSRKCQKEDWPRHKSICTRDSHRRYNCTNCNNSFPMSQRIQCSVCGNENYCSQQCEKKHKVKHQAQCLIFQQFRRPKNNVDNEADLFHQWFDSPETNGSIAANELATHVMTKQQFTNKNPDFVVLFEVRLNKNFLCFAPTKMPEVAYFSEFPPANANQMRERSAQYSKNLKPHQFGHTVMLMLDRTCPISYSTPPVCRARHQILEARDYRRKTLEVTQRGFFQNGFILSRKLEKAWIPILHETLSSQIRGGLLSDTSNANALFHGFVIASYRLQSQYVNTAQMKSGHFQKFLLIRVGLGNELGEVKRILSHSMVLREDVMQQSSELKSFAEDLRDTPTEPGFTNFPIVIMSSASVISPDSNEDNDNNNDNNNGSNIARKKTRKEPNGYISTIVLQLELDPDKILKKSETEIDRDIKIRWRGLCNLKFKFPECKKLNINDFVL